METLKYIFIKLLKVLKWLVIILVSFIALIWISVFIADTFFDNAAKKIVVQILEGRGITVKINVNMLLMIRVVNDNKIKVR